jgi:hemolysin activation/secretion protein
MRFLPWGALLVYLSCGAVQATEVPVATNSEETAAKEVVFDIWEYQVDGNNLLARSEVERLVYPYLGPERSYADVESARDALQQAYRQQGYVQVLVDIPVQDINQGVVRLEVTEPKVENLWVSGSRYFSPRQLRSQLPALGKGTVIQEQRVNEQLSRVNQRNPDLRVVPVLRPGEAPGTVEVEVKVKDELPLHAQVELNNQHTEDTTDLRLKGTVSYGNLWQADHKATLLVLVSPEDLEEVQVLSANYMLPVGDEGKKLLLSVMNTDSAVETIGGITVVGKGNIFSANLIKPLKPANGLYSNLMLGAEYRDLKNQDPVSDKKIDYLSFSANWLGSKLYESGGRTDFDFGITFGFDDLINDQTEFEENRRGAKSGFVVVDGSIERLWNLAGGSTLSAHLRGQLSPFPLISNLQISAGGADSVRGYYESQALADNGVLLSLEWSSPNFGERLGLGVGAKPELRFSAFTEGAYLWDRSPYASDEREYNLASVGVGSRFQSQGGLSAAVDVAWPLLGLGQVEEGDTMAHFKLGYEF